MAIAHPGKSGRLAWRRILSFVRLRISTGAAWITSRGGRQEGNRGETPDTPAEVGESLGWKAELRKSRALFILVKGTSVIRISLFCKILR